MRLTWQVVTVTVAAIWAAVATLKVVTDRYSQSDHALVMHHALDRGGRLVGDSIEMPGDAEPGTYPDGEA